ncbi:MAG: alpha/beta hydrolase [Actinomycetota bacterium]|nr:alpha/beta hydrolase [Actinomycetota bacterium]
MARSSELGDEHEVALTRATIRYRERSAGSAETGAGSAETGAGSPVLFVHGLLVNGDLWRNVVSALHTSGLRCITPDWPLGAHELAVPDGDLTPPGVAAMIAEFLERLDLRDVTIVANDTGGALTQILMTQHPERIGRVVLTPSDSFEHFFPPMFALLPLLARVPGAAWLLIQGLRVHSAQRLPIAFGLLSKRAIPKQFMDSYLSPARHSAAVRADLTRFLRGVHKRHTLAAGAALPRFTKPVLLAWASEDRVFPVKHARRLAAVLPAATLVQIPDSYTFVPEDQPIVLAEHITEFVRTHATA